MKDWDTVYKINSKIKAQFIVDTLENNDIPAVPINKIDSSYNNFGRIHIQVPIDYINKAMEIIDQLNKET